MSLHEKPLSKIEQDGLLAHHFPVGAPSQNADAFRLGIAWAVNAKDVEIAALRQRADALAETIHALSVTTTTDHESKADFIARINAVLGDDPDMRLSSVRRELEEATEQLASQAKTILKYQEAERRLADAQGQAVTQFRHPQWTDKTRWHDCDEESDPETMREIGMSVRTLFSTQPADSERIRELDEIKEEKEVIQDCRICTNRGRANGLSHETYCDSCVFQGASFRMDNFQAPNGGDNGAAQPSPID